MGQHISQSQKKRANKEISEIQEHIQNISVESENNNSAMASDALAEPNPNENINEQRIDLNNANQNVIAETSVIVSSSDESDDNIVESISNGNETIRIEPPRQESNIGHIVIRQSNDVTIGNRIIYNGPVTIHQPLSNQNQNNNHDELAEMMNRSVITTETAGPLRIVARNEWFARPPERKLDRLELPAIRVIIAYTAGASANTHAECAELLRNYQAMHIESKGWDDIGYNFLIGNGSVYVGRGWDYKGAHSRIYNRRSICIAFIGSFYRNAPPACSFIAVKQLIEEGVKLGKLTEDYRLYGHRQLIPTHSPGNKIYEVIQTWDHWTEEVIPP